MREIWGKTKKNGKWKWHFPLNFVWNNCTAWKWGLWWKSGSILWLTPLHGDRVWHPGPGNFASFWMVLVPVPEKFGPKKSTGTRKFSSQKKVPVSVPEKFGTVTLWQVLHSCLSYLNHARIGLVFLYVFFDNPAQKYFQIIRRKIFLDNPAQNIVG